MIVTGQEIARTTVRVLRAQQLANKHGVRPQDVVREQAWTDQRAPIEEESRSGWLLIAGYVTAILFPIVGLVIGIVLLTRRQIGHGVAVVAISIAVGAAGVLISG